MGGRRLTAGFAFRNGLYEPFSSLLEEVVFQRVSLRGRDTLADSRKGDERGRSNPRCDVQHTMPPLTRRPLLSWLRVRSRHVVVV